MINIENNLNNHVDNPSEGDMFIYSSKGYDDVHFLVVKSGSQEKLTLLNLKNMMVMSKPFESMKDELIDNHDSVTHVPASKVTIKLG